MGKHYLGLRYYSGIYANCNVIGLRSLMSWGVSFKTLTFGLNLFARILANGSNLWMAFILPAWVWISPIRRNIAIPLKSMTLSNALFAVRAFGRRKHLPHIAEQSTKSGVFSSSTWIGADNAQYA